MPDSGSLLISIEWLYSLAGLFAGLLLGFIVCQFRKRAMDRRQRSQLSMLKETFASLSGEALQHNNRSFLDLAEQTLQHYQTRARHEFAVKESEFDELIRPIRDSLQQTQVQIQQLEQQRQTAQGALHQQLESLVQSQQSLQSETRNLVNALRRPEVRGQWGEMTLKRLVELAGMSEHCDFTLQVSNQGDEGLLRPDMLIHLPGRRDIVVDVKTPLDAYLSAMEAGDAVNQKRFLRQHTSNVRQRIRELASKTYWQQFKRAPDFIILFIPGDQFLNAALEAEPALLEGALSQKVILATPTSLVALLRAIAYGWRQEKLSENAELIRDLGETLYNRLVGLSEHFSRLGKSLDGSVQAFNRFTGSFESMIIPAARRFTELGISGKKEIPQPEPLREDVRGSTTERGPESR